MDRATVELINYVAEEIRQFHDQDWHGLSPDVEHHLKIFGMFEKAEIKDCIGFYMLTNVDEKYIGYEQLKLKNMREKKIVHRS